MQCEEAKKESKIEIVEEEKIEIDEEKISKGNDDHEEKTTGKKVSWKRLTRFDSFDVEARKINGRSNHRSKGETWSVILQLAFQSIGVVYGDIGTSPLYVYASTFSGGKIKHNDDILGVLSLIFYTLTLIPLVKYVFIVLRANDNGDGGTFALYSLICRYTKVGLIPSQEAEDREVSTFQLELPNNQLKYACRLKSMLENSKFSKFFLLFATMLGTSMVIGDGVLTPCMSVLSAVSGIKEATSSMTEGRIVWISVAILVGLFMVQRFGTDKVGYMFAPIICVWFLLIATIGIYNFIKFDQSVVKAINPKYIVDYFDRNKKEAWISLGGIVLCITGTEALFADLGHFTVRSIQISMCTVTYPALVLAYMGQASFLRKHSDCVSDTFFKSIPDQVYWPMFVVAVLASIIASQAMISGTFSIIQQSLALGCFPRVKIVHTSTKYEGQVYIPEINYLLMLACVAVTVGFRKTENIGNAYGIAVVFVMTLTSSFLVLIMIMIWKTHILLIITYFITIVSVEFLYLSAVLYKFDQGGYLPLAFALVLVIVMYTWNHVYRMKYYYELENKVSLEEVREIALSSDIRRIPGLAIFYSELVHGVPPIFKHYVENIPALHSMLVFVSFKSLPISKVPNDERFIFRRVLSKELTVFRCIVRYGYTDARNNQQETFEKMLVEKLTDFVNDDILFVSAMMVKKTLDENNVQTKDGRFNGCDANQESGDCENLVLAALKKEIEVLDTTSRMGVVHLVGENEVIAGRGSRIGKRILINYAYNFIRRNLRQTEKVFDIPHKRLLKVGMTYEL